MAGHACPWWFGYVLVNPLRRLLNDPARILAPYVRASLTRIARPSIRWSYAAVLRKP